MKNDSLHGYKFNITVYSRQMTIKLEKEVLANIPLLLNTGMTPGVEPLGPISASGVEGKPSPSLAKGLNKRGVQHPAICIIQCRTRIWHLNLHLSAIPFFLAPAWHSSRALLMLNPMRTTSTSAAFTTARPSWPPIPKPHLQTRKGYLRTNTHPPHMALIAAGTGCQRLS